jgi:hypothetical protein
MRYCRRGSSPWGSDGEGHTMILVENWKKVVLENYANFSGRARRQEFWY